MKLAIDGSRLILEAGQEDRWLVTDLSGKTAENIQKSLIKTRESADGLQFIAVQRNPQEEKFTGFWMLRDLSN